MVDKTTISGAGEHAAVALTDRIPASKGGAAGYHTVEKLRDHARSGLSEILATSGVAASHTGNTNETVLETVTIPGGSMGPNGRLRVTTTWSYTNSANAKTLRVRFGGPAGTEYCLNAPTTTAVNRIQHEIVNRGDEASQVSGHAAAHFGFGTGAAALVTSVQNTANDVDLVFSAQLANAGETVTLEHYLVELLVP